RRMAMVLPVPGSPVIMAKPPSERVSSTRRRKASTAGIVWGASTRTWGWRGWKFRAKMARSLAFLGSVLLLEVARFALGQLRGSQARGGVLGHQLAQERGDAGRLLRGRGRRRHLREHTPGAVGVLDLVERQERREVRAFARVDE